ncbi:PAS domain-containing protein [Candidatus Saccharibacteria bacterium]|nr:PAS domain-containing protein [Candidatus Saccharibacteria bacterium]
MSLFNRKAKPVAANNNSNSLSEMALATIHDGVVITDRAGIVQYANPAAATMLDCNGPENAIGLDYGLLIKIESKEGRELTEAENPFIQAMKTGQSLEGYQACLVAGASAKRIPIAISVIPADGGQSNRIITFRNITKELAEEGEQAEFISTASHEMRTPIASIEGYLSLALNPQTATIDARAKGYLESAHNASQHLGRLFRDLLDATKLDDGQVRPHFEPVEMVGAVKQIADTYIIPAKKAKLNFQFGSAEKTPSRGAHRLEQVVYGSVDMNFLREIIDNLIENAIKYTPEGGSIYVNVLGDGDRVLINVTDTGIGISADDLQHIFQKFYRADNSDTRTIGGTGLGLYLVKQRCEAMGGRVWAESAFGEGSTFYVSLPRLTSEEYEKRMIAVRNAGMVRQPGTAAAPAQVVPTAIVAPVVSATPVTPTPTTAPAAAPTATAAPATTASPTNPAPVPAPTPAAPQVSPTPASPAQAATPAAPVAPTVSAAAPVAMPVTSVTPPASPVSATPAPAAPAPVAPTAPPASPMPPAPPTSIAPIPDNTILNNNQNGGKDE